MHEQARVTSPPARPPAQRHAPPPRGPLRFRPRGRCGLVCLFSVLSTRCQRPTLVSGILRVRAWRLLLHLCAATDSGSASKLPDSPAGPSRKVTGSRDSQGLPAAISAGWSDRVFTPRCVFQLCALELGFHFKNCFLIDSRAKRECSLIFKTTSNVQGNVSLDTTQNSESPLSGGNYPFGVLSKHDLDFEFKSVCVCVYSSSYFVWRRG